jgi:hypothetical protein
MQPIQVTVTAFSGDLVSIQLPGGREVDLPRSVFPVDVKEGEAVSLVAVRGTDILNEILKDEETSK